MRPFGRKRLRVLNVMVIDRNTSGRQSLVDRFYNSVRPHISGYGPPKTDKVHKARSVLDAKQKLDGNIKVDMIVFSEELAEPEIDELRVYFYSSNSSPSFLMLRPLVGAV